MGENAYSLILLEPEAKAAVLREEAKQADSLMVQIMPPFCSNGEELTGFRKGNDVVKFGKKYEFKEDQKQQDQLRSK